MSKGHVVLDGVEYVLPDQGAITRSNANQMAAKQGSGAGDYEDLEDWSALLLDNWQGGVGRRDVESGGYLFGTADTRFESQIVMPPQLIPPTASVGAQSYGTSITIGTGLTYTKVAFPFTIGASDVFQYVTMLLPGKIDDGDADRIDGLLFNDNSGVPGSSLGGHVIQRGFDPSYRWVTFSTAATGPAAAGTYYAVVAPLDNKPMTLLGSPTGGFVYNGSAWVAGFCPAGGVQLNAPGASVQQHIVSFNSHIYMADNLEQLWKLSANATWTLIKDFGAQITSLLALGDILYVGLGDSANYQTVNTSDVVSTTPSVPARLFTLWSGLLYRAVGATVSYSADGSTWATAIDIADSGYLVRGMAGFQSDLIVSTDNALYRMAPGDVVLRITPWPNVSSTNGKYILNWQGNLYISQGESLLRYDGAGMLPFGPDLGEGLPELDAGPITGLTASNNWLLCAVDGANASTVWAHNGQGWHCLQRTTWPHDYSDLAVRCLAYGTSFLGSDYVVSSGDASCWYAFRLPDTARSTHRLQDSGAYESTDPSATLETDWFYGSLKEVDKDWESIFVDGDGISVSNYVRVYWQQDNDDDWRFLGTVTTGGQELRWDDYDTRPNARRMKFKFTFVHLDVDNPYRVIAIRVKYMPMVRDRWRWSIPLMVHNRQNMLDGSLNRRNRLLQARHLDGLTNQVPPFIFQDTDGSRYEVKVMNATRQTVKVQYLPESGETIVEYIYNLVIEQVNADEYTGD